MGRKEIKARTEELKALAKQQMGRMERMTLSGALAGVAQHVGDEERVELLFGGQIDGKQAVVALTDRRLLAAYGLIGRSYSVEYTAINQIQTGLTKVEIDGSGVNLTIKSVTRRDELVAAVHERRRAPASAPPAAPADAGDAGDAATPPRIPSSCWPNPASCATQAC